MTAIGIDDKADVRMMLPVEFEDYANKIRKLKNTSLLVGNVNYIYAQGRDDVATEDKSIVATVTAKKVDGQWKIGKYSWVSLGNEIN